MTTATSICRLVDGVLSVVWAPCCATCDVVLDQPSLGVVCGGCWRHVQILTPPICMRCGVPLPAQLVSGQDRRQCPACLVTIPGDPVSRYRIAGWYQGALRSIIHAFKYQGRRSLATPLAAIMREAGRDLLGSVDAVVPVPLHPRRRWTRGFNQARDLAKGLGPPVADVLRRTKHAPPQTTLAAAQRHANVRDIFTLGSSLWCQRDPPIVGRTVVVADDVMTTGATLEACGQVLRAAGAQEVWAITAARVAAPPPRRSRTRRPTRPAGHLHAAIQTASPGEDSSA